MLKVGDLAPEIDLPASDGNVFKLGDRKGRYVVVYFFPAAFTGGCTIETKQFRDRSSELSSLGADVVGISTDSLEKQCSFATSLDAKFPMVGDPDKRVTHAYGVAWPLVGLARRVTFVVGPTQRIEAIFAHELQVGKHVEDVAAFLQGVRK